MTDVDEAALRARHPAAFEVLEVEWSDGMLRSAFELEPPAPGLVSSVRLIAYVGDLAVLIETEEYGPAGLPGGTLEPGETPEEALRREVREEIGAELGSYRVFGRILSGPRPRSRTGHTCRIPVFHWLVAYGDLRIVGEPTLPAGGEHIVRVELLPVAEVCARLEAFGRP